MTHRFNLKAREEFKNACDFYNDQKPGLGYEFAMEVGLAIAVIRDAPNRWPLIDRGIHKYRLDRFPYGILYRILDAQLFEIVAVFDLRAEPGSWR
ncbi:hypothetical protein [Humisphaera borealis]|uniref:Type II toxin-antitoxin system RelE/ParE family toxin n=1 Tax=Humisphaera borealis TaxID=2807512 RepID=A0A7M2WZJ3_9BACT|nr:hypothetical protein [Humisphaera borealis]QOV90859.1 type II toxin-antitoxin system RelE/ParE family toxin [Humisphaera borealis]